MNKTLLTLPAGRKRTAPTTVRADGATYSKGAAVSKPPQPPVPTIPRSPQAKRFEPREPIDARTYFFVWKLDGGRPRVRHATVETAERERVRLQALDPSGVYLTYRAVCVGGTPK
jgi:hypothetical protein